MTPLPPQTMYLPAYGWLARLLSTHKPHTVRYVLRAGWKAGYFPEQVYLAALAMNVLVGKDVATGLYYWLVLP